MKWGQPRTFAPEGFSPSDTEEPEGAFGFWAIALKGFVSAMVRGQPCIATVVATLVLAVPALARADAEETRQMIGGILTAGPAAVGLGVAGSGVLVADRDLWVWGIGISAFGPSVGHIVNGRYSASLALLGIKAAGLGLMYDRASRDDFLEPKRPVDPQFWVGSLMFALAAGAEVYLGADDVQEGGSVARGQEPGATDVISSRDWTVSPWISRGASGVVFQRRFRPSRSR